MIARCAVVQRAGLTLTWPRRPSRRRPWRALATMSMSRPIVGSLVQVEQLRVVGQRRGQDACPARHRWQVFFIVLFPSLPRVRRPALSGAGPRMLQAVAVR
jgi:hypothetical protein